MGYSDSDHGEALCQCGTYSLALLTIMMYSCAQQHNVLEVSAIQVVAVVTQ
jgi:hypothetical protein